MGGEVGDPRVGQSGQYVRYHCLVECTLKESFLLRGWSQALKGRPMLLVTSVETGKQLATAILCSIGPGAPRGLPLKPFDPSQHERSC